MLNEIFREYDIRGIFDKDLNEESVKAIGFVLGAKMVSKGVKTVSVGYDARVSAKALFNYLVSGLNANGLKVYDIGMTPTPVGYFSVFTNKFDANVQITGSHNPKEYNGFKITIGKDSYFGNDLKELGKEVEKIIQDKMEIINDTKAIVYDILSEYIAFFAKEFSHLKDFEYPFAIDCANGTAGITTGRICEALNLKATILYPNPDGTFPNHHPDPSEEKNLMDLKKTMEQNNIKLGFGFDGDADRIAVLTSQKNIKGDELACLLALNMNKPRILGEVKCSQIMYDFIDKFGKSFMSKTGHSNIKKAMKELDIDLAAEVSGHIFFKERYFGFDDGVYAMMRVLELVQKGIDLDGELDKLPQIYSTDEIKIKTTEDKKFIVIDRLKEKISKGIEGLPEITDVIDIDGVRVKFKDGWALVRASNTTPVIVTRFEAKTLEFKEKLQNKFNEILDELIQQ